MRVRLFRVVCVLLLLAPLAAAARQQGRPEPERVQLDIYYRTTEWVLSPPVRDEHDSTEEPGVTRSVFAALVQAVDPRTRAPYVPVTKDFGCDPSDVRHSLQLEKREFLLGEPIVVEHRIELSGAGSWEWTTGGNYRARGRDDNFSFVLRRADGTFVPDPYPSLGGVVLGGGLMGVRAITRDKPFSEWYGLQRYAAVNEPGDYELYCIGGYRRRVYGEREAMQAALPEEVARDHFIDKDFNLIDRRTGARSERYEVSLNIYSLEGEPSPLYKTLPPEVYGFAQGHTSPAWMPEVAPDLGVVAHFRVHVREGTAEERRQMAERWLAALSAPGAGPELNGSYKTAVRDAVWYSWQNDFFGHVEHWIGRAKVEGMLLPLEGLALRPDREAFELLTKAPAAAAVNSLYNLNRERVADAVPLCIEWLTHPNAQVRVQAESLLVLWTGRKFEHAWGGYDYQRPTPEEGKRMQPLWRAWWENNKSGFKPCPRGAAPLQTKGRRTAPSVGAC
jgi:hypothetical protein